MPRLNRLCPALGLWLAAGLLAACQPATPLVGVTPVTTAATPTASPVPPASETPTVTQTLRVSATFRVSTDTPTPATPTATPTVTQTLRVSTDTATPAQSATGSLTAAPTGSLTAAATGSLTAAATRRPRPAATATPTGPTPTASATAAPPLYSTTGGPAGYSSRIVCQRAGAACQPVMAPGDLSFQLVLASDASAPWTHFVNYGLSVQKDGANAADLFMFVDAGWLQPGEVVGFGASRSFSQPGQYVIRSSGCLTTDAKSNDCVWQTMAGTVVTFQIVP